MFQYFAYGLGIHSKLRLPEFVQQASVCDVTVTLQPPSSNYADLSQPRKYLKVSPQETIVVIQNIAHFQVCQGREIIVTPFPQSEERLIQLCIAGSIIAILLYQRGFQVLLHASAIALKDQAVCFLGNSGDGKSSTAAALVAHGHRIVSDDVVPVLIEPLSVRVVPAYPQIKIGPEIAKAFGYSFDSLSFLHPCLGEYAYRAEANFSPDPLPFSRVYILNDSDELSIQVLPPQEAMVELIRHTYGLSPFREALDANRHFLSCIELLNHVVVCRLNRPRSIPLLSEVVRLIERDVLHPAQTLSNPL
ncbi:MAG: hypothetical protein WCA35_08515 [Kovacikia sp.]